MKLRVLTFIVLLFAVCSVAAQKGGSKKGGGDKKNTWPPVPKDRILSTIAPTIPEKEWETVDNNYINQEVAEKMTEFKQEHQQDIPAEKIDLNVFTETVASRTCATWGPYHYRTFHGKMFYYPGKCSYTFARDCYGDLFKVMLEYNANCNSSCFPTTHIYLRATQYSIRLDSTDFSVYQSGHTMSMPVITEEIVIEPRQRYLVARATVGLTVIVALGGTVTIQISDRLKDKRTCGLCGSCFGPAEEDLMSTDGNYMLDARSFGNSWTDEEKGFCSDVITDFSYCNYDSKRGAKVSEESNQKCAPILSLEYKQCHTLIDPNPYYEACQLDCCKQRDSKECECSSLAEYFRECRRLGGRLHEGWRTFSLCPLSCLNGTVYSECTTSCQASCQNPDPVCENKDCLDGCQCPAQQVLQEGQCIPKVECGCERKGKKYTNGEKVAEDCNTCECIKGEWICTTNVCSARCTISGHHHIVTFDGLWYQIPDSCAHYLLSLDDYAIILENVPCAGSKGAISKSQSDSSAATCSRNIKIQTPDGSIIKLKLWLEVTINGEEVVALPITFRGVFITTISSLYVQADLPNGVQVMWNGEDIGYIIVPATFYKKTKGLCGTYTGQQTDDFLTPEGDTELEPATFSQKWSVLDTCAAPPRTTHHPCDYPNNKRPSAERLCSAMQSGVFEACKETVDSTPFYDACLYELCSCREKMEACLCSQLEHFSQVCASKGVLINWRSSVPECGLHCSRGLVYNQCVPNCKSSCAQISLQPACQQKLCFDGCACPEGQTIGETGHCVPVESCGCLFQGKEYPAGFEQYRNGKLCDCRSGQWECRFQSPDATTPAPLDSYTSCLDAENKESVDCVSECPLTCSNMHSPPKCSTKICRLGCRCKKGYILDKDTDICVRPEQCPCHHGGKSYAEGKTMQIECNFCVCKRSQWICEKNECFGQCAAWGDNHYKTFDGHLYDFHGKCDYVLAKGPSFSISMHNVPCGNAGGQTCSKTLTFKTDDGSVTLSRFEPLPTSEVFKIQEVGLFVHVSHKIGVEILWSRHSQLYIRVDPSWKGKLQGLCGDFDGDGTNDFKLPAGGLPEVEVGKFAESWKFHDYCPVSQVVDRCDSTSERRQWALQECSVMKSDLFKQCHAEVPLQPYFQRCVSDACQCSSGGDCECLCTAIAVYAHECASHGISIPWRSQDLCPIQCKECDIYKPCIPICPPDTCELRQTTGKAICRGQPCVEGCAAKTCPDGHIYNDTSSKICIPEGDCKFLPECVVNGKHYNEGEWIEDGTISDACQTCYCENGEVACKGLACTTERPSLPIVECIISGWSEWMNSYTPDEKSLGDYEELDNPRGNLLTKYQLPCPVEHVTRVECRPVGGTHVNQENIECSLPKGLACTNREGSTTCLDYEIRVYCQCGPEPTTTPLPTISPCTLEQNGWSQWMNTHKPSDSKKLEIEKIDYLRKKYELCGPHFITDIECRVAKTKKSWQEAGQVGATCDLDKGLVCEHRKQPKGKKCFDYEVRVYCQCLAPTTVAPYIATPPGNEYCPQSMSWSSCAYKCDQTCQPYRRKLVIDGICAADNMTGVCVPGCQKESCDPPYLQLDEFTCVLSAHCNCVWEDGSIITAGAVVQRKCEKCQCLDNSLVCEHVEGCLPTSAPQIVSTCPPPIIPLCDDGFKLVLDDDGVCPRSKCVEECPPGLKWYECHATCQKTCTENIKRDCKKGCISGCFCPEGQVRDGDICKPPDQCPDRVCQGFGDPQLVSFDGAMFNFQGRGTFVLANHEESSLKVRGKADHCELKMVCIVGMEVEYQGHHVAINRGEHVKIDNHPVTYEKMPIEIGGLVVLGFPGDNILVVVPEISTQIYYFSTHAAFSIRVPVSLFFNKTGGLCGNCDFVEDDDINNDKVPDMCEYMEEDLGACLEDNQKIEIMPPGKTVEEFCAEFSDPIFRECARQVDPHPYRVSCAYDVSKGSANQTAICKSLLEFTRHCCQAGVHIGEWMKKFGCSVECPEGAKFTQCHDACPQTCGNESRMDCHLYKTDGCFCPEGMVFHSGICVSKTICDVCDEAGHKPGESWDDGPCTTCHCDIDLHVVCNTQTCPTGPVCRSDEMMRLINGTCCNTYKCELKPSPTCPPPVVPNCAPGEVAKIKTVKGVCPTYICECDPGLCPPVRWPEELEPGEEIKIVYEECCSVVQVVCNKTLCPVPAVCSPGLELKVLPGVCCPSYKCKAPDDVCLYTAKVKVENYAEIPILPSEQYPKSYKPGETWQDGLCRNCTCEGQEDHYSAKCIHEQCVSMEDSADYSDYVLSKVNIPGNCCPHIIRLFCKDTEANVHEIGTEWKHPDNNCLTYRCEATSLGEAFKVERAISCAKCPEATEYVAPKSKIGQCCGWCRPVMCEDGGEMYPIGAKWNSTVHKCYSAECVREGNNVKTIFTSPKCRIIEKSCPDDQIVWDKTGCCKKCNITVAPKHTCLPTPVTKEIQTKVLSINHPKYGLCTSYQKSLNLRACAGGCDSHSYYSTDSESYTGVCHCCGVAAHENIEIKYDCSKGRTVKKSYKQPTKCHCVPCKDLGQVKEKQPETTSWEKTAQEKGSGLDQFGQETQETKDTWPEKTGQTTQEKNTWPEDTAQEKNSGLDGIGQTTQEKNTWPEEPNKTEQETTQGEIGRGKQTEYEELDEWLKQIQQNQHQEKELLELQKSQNGGHRASTTQELGKDLYEYEKEPEGLDEHSKQIWRHQQREKALLHVQEEHSKRTLQHEIGGGTQAQKEPFDIKKAMGDAMHDTNWQEHFGTQQHETGGSSNFRDLSQQRGTEDTLWPESLNQHEGQRTEHHYEEKTPNGHIRSSSQQWSHSSSSSSSSSSSHSSSSRSQLGNLTNPVQPMTGNNPNNRMMMMTNSSNGMMSD